MNKRHKVESFHLKKYLIKNENQINKQCIMCEVLEVRYCSTWFIKIVLMHDTFFINLVFIFYQIN